MIRVLFVCLGNICRSPMAESIFNNLVKIEGLDGKIEVDSAGIIDYHAGELPDKRMRETAKKHNIYLEHRSRQLTPKDFTSFDYIIGMDGNNMQGIQKIAKHVNNTHVQLFKMREFDKQSSGKDVEDPYYQRDTGFEICYQVLKESCEGSLEHITKEHALKK